MADYLSDTFFHFVGRKDPLLSGELINPSMTCFAEIREEHLAIHISKYGYFGVGLPSHFLIDRGARPVIYVPLRSDDWRRPGGITALQDIEQIYRGFLEHVVEPRRVTTSMRPTMGTRPSTEDEAVHLMASTSSGNSSRTSSRSIRSYRTIIATTTTRSASGAATSV